MNEISSITSISAEGDISAASVVEVTVVKNQTFRCTRDMDLLVLKSVQITGAHVANFGEATEKYEKACVQFTGCHPIKSSISPTLPFTSWKTLIDWFKTVAPFQMAEVVSNRDAPGIEQENDELEQVLEDLISEIDDDL